jgi:hypothetical protein
MLDPVKSPTAGYSAEVSIELQVGDERFDVASFGGERMVVRNPRALRACTGFVRVTVDGDVATYHVKLPAGLEPTRRHQPVILLPQISAVA